MKPDHEKTEEAVAGVDMAAADGLAVAVTEAVTAAVAETVIRSSARR
jgi:hypothetical protein